MAYLFYAGDDRFGALGVSTSTEAYLPRSQGPLPRLAQAQQLSEIVRKVSDQEPVNAIERRMLAAGGSFGGTKPKALIDIGGEQWIIKFFNNEPIDVPLIEHAAMTLARLAGIAVAETRVLALAGEQALAVRRYDRDGARRIHCVSAGTALRAQTIAGQEPELGYPGLAQLLRRAGVADADQNLRDMQQLFRRMVFNILIDNTDDHEKNHALMVLAPTRQGRYRLAPAYDVLPTNSGQGYQEIIVGTEQRDSTLANAMSQCALFGHTSAQAAAEVIQVIQVVDGWRQHFAACGVTQADLDSLAERIDSDALLGQRRGFNPGDYAATMRRRCAGRAGVARSAGERTAQAAGLGRGAWDPGVGAADAAAADHWPQDGRPPQRCPAGGAGAQVFRQVRPHGRAADADLRPWPKPGKYHLQSAFCRLGESCCCGPVRRARSHLNSHPFGDARMHNGPAFRGANVEDL